MIRLRKSVALLAAAILLAACLMLYLAIEVAHLPINTDEIKSVDQNEISNLEVRLTKLETDLKENHKSIDEIMATVKVLFQPELHNHRTISAIQRRASGVQNNSDNDCTFSETPASTVDIQMLNVYEDLLFDNPDGGVWKQGWPITYNASRWNDNSKLKVFVVPHSHNDPGWIKTFEKYYYDQTQHILDNMVEKLNEDERRKFVWAEISFFSFWWNRITEDKRVAVRRLIHKGQLEIVSGGWVMNDEANTHFFAILQQIVEGHEWLQNHIGVLPKNGWSIDPFGLSPTMAYLSKRMGFSGMIIQRVHYSIKKYLAKQQNLEFIWRQTWDRGNTTDMLCHLMPFYSYDIPHTCGPDPQVCCQFDFVRLSGGKIYCPWRIPPQLITPHNVAERARLLLDQYRKKAQLYKTNVLFVPLGDDFRYDTSNEWDKQYTNYQMLFDYLNNKRNELNVQIQFGTLQDYFQALDEEIQLKHGGLTQALPSLSGDFFTYADRDDHYWSGYYTSRPFYKNMDRILEAHVRGGDIIFSIMAAQLDKMGLHAEKIVRPLLSQIVDARRNLGLFQHHDAIAGTAKDFVVIDYGNRLLRSIKEMQTIISRSAEYLLLDALPSNGSPVFTVDEDRESQFSIPMKLVIKMADSQTSLVIFYNSLGQRRQEMVSLHVTTPYVCVRDADGNVVPNQVNPIWLENQISSEKFEIVFISSVPALGLAIYTLETVTKSEIDICGISVPSIAIYNSEWDFHRVEPFDKIEDGTPSEFTISNSNLEAIFHSTGLLKSIKLKDSSVNVNTEIQFLKYGTTNKKDKSGAYLFMPDSEAQMLSADFVPVHIVRGALLSEVNVHFPVVLHTVQIKTSPGIDGLGIDIHNVVNIVTDVNKELVMRIMTSISNTENEFFTDLNGFQVLRRKTFQKLPLQANFYPMTTVAYLQDATSRFTVFTGQSLGVASLQRGWIEVMQDRRLNQDDNRGLQQGVMDNKRTLNSFRLLLEKYTVPSEPMAQLHNQPGSFLSLAGHSASLSLLNPMFTLVASASTINQSSLARNVFSPTGADLPCDMHLVSLRSDVKETPGVMMDVRLRHSYALFLQRLGYDCQAAQVDIGCTNSDGMISIGTLFPDHFDDQIVQTSLSLMYNEQTLNKTTLLHLEPMELYAFRLTR